MGTFKVHNSSVEGGHIDVDIFPKLGPKANSNSHQHFERQKLSLQEQSLHHLELPWSFHKSKAIELKMYRILFLTFSDILP